MALTVMVSVALGSAGAAAWPSSSPPVADDFGSGDGLHRYVVLVGPPAEHATPEKGPSWEQNGAGPSPTSSAAPDAAAPSVSTPLEAAPGIVSAQPLGDDQVLVATKLSATEVARLPGVVGVSDSAQVPVRGAGPSDPFWASYGWNLENTGSNAPNQSIVADADVNASTAWAATQGQSMVVAVVDTGFDSDHPDLVGSLWTNPNEPCGRTDADQNGKAGDCHGWNFYANSPDVDNGTLGSHGTSVAGVVGARVENGAGSAGVAPQIKLMPLVIGAGSSVDVNLASLAIRYAADHGADAITASWGGGFTGPALENLKSAVAYAEQKGVLIAVAAGNDARNRDAGLDYPTNLPNDNLITVGSSNAADTMSASSAYGATQVDLFAPGNRIATTWNDGGYRLVSGTSMAAPHVAAAVALYKSVRPTATAAELKAAIMADTKKLPAFDGKSLSGGRLDLAALASGPVKANVSYTFTGMSGGAGAVVPRVVVTANTGSADYAAALSLHMKVNTSVWAVAGRPVTLGGVRKETDDTGTAVFPLGSMDSFGTVVLSPTLLLGGGDYSLGVQILKDGEPIGRPFAAPVKVGAGGAVTAMATTWPRSGPFRLTSLSPNRVLDSDGGTVTITGEALPAGLQVKVAGVPVELTTSSATSASFVVPAHAPGRVSIALLGAGRTMNLRSAVEYYSHTTRYRGLGTFKVTSMSPNRLAIAGGDVVTVTGLNLPLDPRVRLGTVGSVTVLSSSRAALTFQVPEWVSGKQDVVITGGGGSVVLPKAVEYLAAVPSGAGLVGPGNEKLMQNSTYAVPLTLWSKPCAPSCGGVQV